VTAPAFPVQHVTVGIAKEPSFGTVTAPAYFIPALAPTATDIHNPVPDVGWRGPAADGFGHVPGILEGDLALGGNVHADTIGYALAGILGDAVAAGSGPTTWTIAVNNTLTEEPSYTVTITDPVNSRQWAGAKFAALVLSSTAAGALTWTSKLTSLPSVIGTAPATSYTGVGILAGWRLAAQIGGAAVASVLSSTVTITRATVPKRNTDGSRSPYLIHSGICSVAGTLQLIMQTDTYRALYVAGTSTSIDLNYAQGAGAGATQTRIHCSDVTLTKVAPDYATGAFQQVKVDWKADYNTTDVGASGGWSPVKVTLQNAVGTGVYL
jgi:hypothetical protein